MQKTQTDDEAAPLGTKPDRLLAERLYRAEPESGEQRALLEVEPHCAPRTHAKAKVYLSRDDGLEPLGDKELVRVS